MLYEIVEAPSTAELAGQVEEMIAEGWEPLGGVCSYTPNINEALVGKFARNHFVQAMIKRD